MISDDAVGSILLVLTLSAVGVWWWYILGILKRKEQINNEHLDILRDFGQRDRDVRGAFHRGYLTAEEANQRFTELTQEFRRVMEEFRERTGAR